MEDNKTDTVTELEKLQAWRSKADEAIGQLEEKFLNSRENALNESVVEDVAQLKKWRENLSEELDQIENDQKKLQLLIEKLDS